MIIVHGTRTYRVLDHPADPAVLDDLVVHADLDPFPHDPWFPTPARILGDAANPDTGSERDG